MEKRTLSQRLFSINMQPWCLPSDGVKFISDFYNLQYQNDFFIGILDIEGNLKTSLKNSSFALIIELENVGHSDVGVLAHGYLNEQVLCETGTPYLITHGVPSSLGQGLG